MSRLRIENVAIALGALSLLLIMGALGFQYLARLPPCEMCMWQRYPHVLSSIVGLIGGSAVATGLLDRSLGRPIAILTALLVAISGAIAVYHAGVEWHWWKGPSACTSTGLVHITGSIDFNAPVVMCDRAAWRMFGLSLAGYNAIISLVAAAIGFFLIARAGGKRV